MRETPTLEQDKQRKLDEICFLRYLIGTNISRSLIVEELRIIKRSDQFPTDNATADLEDADCR
jgi:hypothetical protein